MHGTVIKWIKLFLMMMGIILQKQRWRRPINQKPGTVNETAGCMRVRSKKHTKDVFSPKKRALDKEVFSKMLGTERHLLPFASTNPMTFHLPPPALNLVFKSSSTWKLIFVQLLLVLISASDYIAARYTSCDECLFHGKYYIQVSINK